MPAKSSPNTIRNLILWKSYANIFAVNSNSEREIITWIKIVEDSVPIAMIICYKNFPNKNTFLNEINNFNSNLKQ